MARPAYFTASGTLTPYAFACGYIERRGGMVLGKEHGTYHVKGSHNGQRVWESCGKLGEARAFFRRFPETADNRSTRRRQAQESRRFVMRGGRVEEA